MNSGLFLASAAVSLIAAAPATALPKNFAAEADKLVDEAWKANGPGAAVIVTEGGKTVYTRGRGLADLDKKTPITPDTVFRIGSITKQFAAAVMMQLVDEGKVSLDDPLSKYIPDYPQPGASSTVRQLLNHTSGIKSYTGIDGWMIEANINRPYTTAQMIDVFKALPSVTKPGEAWDYNNSGYVLVGAIIEKVTGKPWYEAVAERISTPLQLKTLRYGVGEEQVPAMATGYRPDGDTFKPAEKIHMSVPHAAGALIGTVGDLATWANALHHGSVVSGVSYAGMTSAAKLSGGKDHPYGYGLELGELRGLKTVGHGGGIFGFVTASTYIPEKDLFVAVFTNSAPPVTSPDTVASKLAALAMGEPFPSFRKEDADLKALAPYFGKYAISGGTGERLFFARDGKLFTRRDGPPQEVFAAGNQRFFYPDGLTWFTLKQDGKSRLMEMHLPTSASVELARRSGPVPPDPKGVAVPAETLKRYVGSYAVFGTEAIVTHGDDGLSVKLGDQPRLLLKPLSDKEFEVEGVGAKLVFSGGGESGPATSMTINQGGRTTEAKRAD